MKETYEFFKKEVVIQGKHARMIDEMVRLNDYNKSYLKRAIDVYILAPVVGFHMKRKEPIDTSNGDTKTIFLQQVLDAKEDLDFLLQLILLLECGKEEEDDDNKEHIKRGFGEVTSKEQFEKYNSIFHEYVRGGIELLYEDMIIYQPELDCEYTDPKTDKLMSLLNRLKRSNTSQKRGK